MQQKVLLYCVTNWHDVAYYKMVIVWLQSLHRCPWFPSHRNKLLLFSGHIIPVNATSTAQNQCTEEPHEKTKDAASKMRQRQLQLAQLPDPEMDEFVAKINKRWQERAAKKSASFQVTNEDIMNCSREQES